MKTRNIFGVAVVLACTLFSGCRMGLDTDPFNTKETTLLAFGPADTTQTLVQRLEDLRIVGTHLDRVGTVVFPKDVEVKAFKSHTANEIIVTVPDEAIVGKLRLLAGSQEIVSKSTLCYREPISIDTVYAATGLRGVSAGDIITVKGDYLYNIGYVQFGHESAVVLSEDFEQVARRELKIKVPDNAVTGNITFGNDIPWMQVYPDSVEIISASFDVIADAADFEDGVYEFGRELHVVGTNLHTIADVKIGEVPVPFMVEPVGAQGKACRKLSVYNEQLVLTIPSECASGKIMATNAAGATVVGPEVKVPTVSIDFCSQSVDLRPGDVVTIQGRFFDRIKQVVLYGDVLPEEGYVRHGDSITFHMPADASKNGKIELVQNAYITAVQMLKVYRKPTGAENVLAENISIGCNGAPDWTAIEIDGGFDWTSVSVGDVLYIKAHRDAGTSDYNNFKLINMDWALQIGCFFTEEGIEDNETTTRVEEKTFEIELTQEMLDAFIAKPMAAAGHGAVIDKVYFLQSDQPITTSGINIGCNGAPDWTATQIDGDFDWTTAKVGQVLYIKAHRDAGTTDYNNFKLINMDWALQIGCFFTEEGIEDNETTTRVEEKTFEIELTQEMLDAFIAKPMAAAGHGVVIDKVSLSIVTENVLMAGEVGIGCLGGADWTATQIDGDFDWSGASVGQTLRVYARRDAGTSDYNNFKLINMDWALQIGCFFTEEGIEDNETTTRVEEKVFEFELTQEMLDAFTAKPMAAAGHGAVITKVSLE